MGDKSRMIAHHLAAMKPECMLCEKKTGFTLFQTPLTRQKKKDLCNVSIVLGVQLIMKGHFLDNGMML